MTKQRCLIITLALAGMMLLAGPGLAQKQGGGPGRGPGSQVCTGGPGGICTINPNTPANQNCPAPGTGKSQKRQGMKGSGGGARSNQPDTQTKVPEAGQ